jgi:hypothetical protein
MFNTEKTFGLNLYYSQQRDLFLQGIIYSFAVIGFLEVVRAQISEVNLLQLIPGFYLFLLFLSFLFLVFFSTLFFRVPSLIDNQKSFGTKTTQKVQLILLLKFSLFLFLSCLLLVLNSIIPISLDSFNSYGEKTLENTWSFDEVITLEIILLLILIALSQLPLVFVKNFHTEKNITFLPDILKTLSFFVVLGSGLLTPTIDGYTQIGFAGSALSFYLIIINLLQKRIRMKLASFSTLQ